MLPMTRAKAESFWTAVAASLERGERAVVVAEDPRGQIMGTAQAIWAPQENQPHRADIAKMLVRRNARRHGVGALVLEAAERAAFEAGKTLLVLDTASPEAERLYERGGWSRVGAIPKYALMPDGPFCSSVFFYKDLAAR
jgi:GNAT superfamily N-acetyltransferase